jgi:benzoyl-CoA 2,3-dioxygenase component B
VRAGKVPVEIIQKYLNKWLSTGYDLFGKDRSTSAARFYRWGFKGRFDEAALKTPPADMDRVNEEARGHYYREDCEIIAGLNSLLPADGPKLRAPSIKFNRQIGDYAGQTFSVEGERLSPTEYEKHLKQVLPGPAEREQLRGIFTEGDWVTGGTAH